MGARHDRQLLVDDQRHDRDLRPHPRRSRLARLRRTRRQLLAGVRETRQGIDSRPLVAVTPGGPRRRRSAAAAARPRGLGHDGPGPRGDDAAVGARHEERLPHGHVRLAGRRGDPSHLGRLERRRVLPRRGGGTARRRLFHRNPCFRGPSHRDDHPALARRAQRPQPRPGCAGQPPLLVRSLLPGTDVLAAPNSRGWRGAEIPGRTAMATGARSRPSTVRSRRAGRRATYG